MGIGIEDGMCGAICLSVLVKLSGGGHIGVSAFWSYWVNRLVGVRDLVWDTGTARFTALRDARGCADYLLCLPRADTGSFSSKQRVLA